MPRTSRPTRRRRSPRCGAASAPGRADRLSRPSELAPEEVEGAPPGVTGRLGVVARGRGVVEEGVPDVVVDARREVDARVGHALLELGHAVGDAVVLLTVERE